MYITQHTKRHNSCTRVLGFNLIDFAQHKSRELAAQTPEHTLICLGNLSLFSHLVPWPGYLEPVNAIRKSQNYRPDWLLVNNHCFSH